MTFNNYSVNTTFNNNGPIDVNVIKKMLKGTEPIKEVTQKEFPSNDTDDPSNFNTPEGILTQMDSDDEMNRKQPATETKNSSDKSLFVTPDGNTNKGTTAGIAPSYAGFTTADDNPILITPKLIKHKKILTLQEINPPNPLGKNNSMSSTITTNVIPFNRNTYEGDTNIPSSPDGNSPSKDSVPVNVVPRDGFHVQAGWFHVQAGQCHMQASRFHVQAGRSHRLL
jgi:hypothetical protein